MRNIYDVLQQKEAEIQRLREELRALIIVAPLLEEAAEDGEIPEIASSSVLGSDLSHAANPGETGETSEDPLQKRSTQPTWSWGRLNLKKDPSTAA